MCFCLGIAGLRTSPGNHNIMSWPDYPFWSVSVIHDELVRNIRDMAWLVVTSFSTCFPTCFHHSIFKWCWSLISTDLFIFWGSNFPPTVGKNSRDTRSWPLIRGHVGSHRRNQELPQNSGHAGALFREIHGTAGHISLGKPCDSMVFVGYAYFLAVHGEIGVSPADFRWIFGYIAMVFHLWWLWLGFQLVWCKPLSI